MNVVSIVFAEVTLCTKNQYSEPLFFFPFFKVDFNQRAWVSRH